MISSKSLTVLALASLMGMHAPVAAHVSSFEKIAKLVGVVTVASLCVDLPGKIKKDFNRTDVREETSLKEDVVNVCQVVSSTVAFGTLVLDNQGLVETATTGAIIGATTGAIIGTGYVVLNRLSKRHDLPMSQMAGLVLTSAMGRFAAEKIGLPVLNVSNNEGVDLDRMRRQLVSLSGQLKAINSELQRAEDIISRVSMQQNKPLNVNHNL